MRNGLFQRLIQLTGEEAAAALERSRVIVVGLGGVGSWCAEALVRSGVGNISLVDADKVNSSNINRQVQASTVTIGRYKAEVLKERLLDINPSCAVGSFPLLFTRDTAELFDIPGADYVIDAIDSLPHKLDLIEAAHGCGRLIFSSMGMAQKLDPTLVRKADIWETSGCPLARLVRQGLRKRNFSGHFTAVYSPERYPNQEAVFPESGSGDETDTVLTSPRKPIGSAVTVTAAAGLVLASLVLQDVCCRFSPGGSSPGRRYE